MTAQRNLTVTAFSPLHHSLHPVKEKDAGSDRVGLWQILLQWFPWRSECFGIHIPCLKMSDSLTPVFPSQKRFVLKVMICLISAHLCREQCYMLYLWLNALQLRSKYYLYVLCWECTFKQMHLSVNHFLPVLVSKVPYLKMCLFLLFLKKVCVCLFSISGVDWFVEYYPAWQHSSLATSEGTEREHWAQQNPPWFSRPTRVWVRVRSGTWPRPGPYFRTWVGARAWYGTGSRTRTGRGELWFT